MFFNPHPDPDRNKTYDSFIHNGKIVNVSICYNLTDNNGYILKVEQLPSSEGVLDVTLAHIIAHQMSDFLIYQDNVEYNINLIHPSNGVFEFELKPTRDYIIGFNKGVAKDLL